MHAELAGETLSIICVNPCPSVAFPKAEFRRALTTWYRKHGRDLPWRRTRDPYAILVSEFMLQQTQVATVIPYYHEWFRQFPDFAALNRASENDILRAWQGLGYYARARNLHATARAVVDRFRGRFPRSIEQMQRLPGIGKYTAHAIASFAFDQAVPIIEANTARVLVRILNFRRPIDRRGGREKLCRAKNPETLPTKKERPPMERLTENHALIIRADRILLEKADRRWRCMWILPRLQRTPLNRRPIYRSIFPFTNHRVTLNVYTQCTQKIDDHSQRWIRVDSLDSIPIPSPHRKALRHLLNEAIAARSRRQRSSGS